MWRWWQIEGVGLLYALWLTALFAFLDYSAWLLFGLDAPQHRYVTLGIGAWCGYSACLWHWTPGGTMTAQPETKGAGLS